MAIPEPEFSITPFQLMKMLEEMEIRKPKNIKEMIEYGTYLKLLMLEHLDTI